MRAFVLFHASLCMTSFLKNYYSTQLTPTYLNYLHTPHPTLVQVLVEGRKLKEI